MKMMKVLLLASCYKLGHAQNRADDCHLESSDRHLRSADTRTCVVPRTNTRFGGQNLLSINIEQSAVFKQHLKSYLFNAI